MPRLMFAGGSYNVTSGAVAPKFPMSVRRLRISLLALISAA